MSPAGRDWRVWSTTAHVLVTDPAALDDAAAMLDEWTTAVGDACDRFRPDSELSRLAPGTTRVSPLLARLLAGALDAAARTGGLVDPTVGEALAAAGYDRDIALVIRDGRPARATRPAPGWRSIGLRGDLVTLPDHVRLDLGATAKAACADLAAADIAATLGCGVLVNLGGDLATAGGAPAGGWQVTVHDGPGEPATRVGIADGWALATSSTRRRAWSAGDLRMHHLIDPATGRPAAPVWRTASVVSRTAEHANSWSTAAMVLGPRAAATLERVGLAARLVAADGSVVHVGGWPAEQAPRAA